MLAKAGAASAIWGDVGQLGSRRQSGAQAAPECGGVWLGRLVRIGQNMGGTRPPPGLLDDFDRHLDSVRRGLCRRPNSAPTLSHSAQKGLARAPNGPVWGVVLRQIQECRASRRRKTSRYPGRPLRLAFDVCRPSSEVQRVPCTCTCRCIGSLRVSCWAWAGVAQERPEIRSESRSDCGRTFVPPAPSGALKPGSKASRWSAGLARDAQRQLPRTIRHRLHFVLKSELWGRESGTKF